MGQARKKVRDMVTPAISPVQAPQKRKSAKQQLIEKFMGFVDMAEKKMSKKELAAAEEKTDAVIARVRALQHEKK
jgi:hypothetical protein